LLDDSRLSCDPTGHGKMVRDAGYEGVCTVARGKVLLAWTDG
jgi:hypothetical protein